MLLVVNTCGALYQDITLETGACVTILINCLLGDIGRKWPGKYMYCSKHNYGPLDSWYDCSECYQEAFAEHASHTLSDEYAGGHRRYLSGAISEGISMMVCPLRGNCSATTRCRLFSKKFLATRRKRGSPIFIEAAVSKNERRVPGRSHPSVCQEWTVAHERPVVPIPVSKRARLVPARRVQIVCNVHTIGSL